MNVVTKESVIKPIRYSKDIKEEVLAKYFANPSSKEQLEKEYNLCSRTIVDWVYIMNKTNGKVKERKSETTHSYNTYSDDLKSQVLKEYINKDSKLSTKEIAEKYGIKTSIIYYWASLYKKTKGNENYDPKKEIEKVGGAKMEVAKTISSLTLEEELRSLKQINIELQSRVNSLQSDNETLKKTILIFAK